MVDFRNMKKSRTALAAGAAVLVVLGAIGGATAVAATRPSVEMAPMVRTPIAKLPQTHGVSTVKGRVAAVYGDRFIVQDDSGHAMVDAGPTARSSVSVGQPIMVQGRFDDGQMHASYLVGKSGNVQAVGPVAAPPPPPGAPGHGGPPPPPPGGPGRDGPPPPPAMGPGHAGPPPVGSAPAPGGPGAAGAVPQTNAAVDANRVTPNTRPASSGERTGNSVSAREGTG